MTSLLRGRATTDVLVGALLFWLILGTEAVSPSVGPAVRSADERGRSWN